MKSEFEKELEKKAMDSVPDRWNEIKKEASEITPDASVKLKKAVNYKPVIAAAASLIIVVGCVVAVKSVSSKKIKTAGDSGACYVTDESLTTKIQITDENGNVSEVEGYYAYDEGSTVILDDKGEVIGKVSNSEIIDDNGQVVGKVETTAPTVTATYNNTIPGLETEKSETTTWKYASTTVAETKNEKNWDEKGTPEKFSALNLYSNEYTYVENVSFRKATLASENVELTALDGNDKAQKAQADVYTLSGFNKNLAVGLKFADDQQYPYVYVNTAYKPATLGDMLDDMDWENSVTYGYINYESLGNFPVSAANVSKYLLADRTVKNQNSRPTGRYVRIDVSCDELGLQNKVLDVFENGYIYTNIVGYNFSFNVGTKAVNDFLKASNNLTFDEIFSATTKANNQTVNRPVNGTTAGYSEAQTAAE